MFTYLRVLLFLFTGKRYCTQNVSSEEPKYGVGLRHGVWVSPWVFLSVWTLNLGTCGFQTCVNNSNGPVPVPRIDILGERLGVQCLRLTWKTTTQVFQVNIFVTGVLNVY